MCSGKRHNVFKTNMLPILTAALQDLDLQPTSAEDGSGSLNHELVDGPFILRNAKYALGVSSELMACYKMVARIASVDSNASDTKSTFETDKNETMRAFESAKKMTINELQSRLANKTGEASPPFELDNREHHLARTVLSRGKGDDSSKQSTNLGPLLYNVGKTIERMQNLVDLAEAIGKCSR